jgi:glyoxylase-like metal-dependent hydrolase (beta-lactamase superfamily II)
VDHLGCNHQFDRILMHPAEFDRYCSGGKRTAEGLIPLWEGDRITVGDYTFEVILIPGHTPGSIALLERNKRFLIGGDTVQNDAIFMFGPGRNMPAFIHTVEKLEKMADCFDVIYPSHGSLTVTPDILPKLKQGAVDVMAGKVEGQPPIWEGMPCKLYDCGGVKFLYDLSEE